MEKGLRRLLGAAGWLGIAAFVFAALLFVLFILGLQFWTQPLDADVAPAVLALVVLYAFCIAALAAGAVLAGVCLGAGIYQVRAAAKGELRRRVSTMCVLVIVFSVIALAVTLLFLIFFHSLQSGFLFLTGAAYGAVAAVGAVLCAVCAAAVVLQGLCLSRLRRALKAQQAAMYAAPPPPPYTGYGG